MSHELPDGHRMQTIQEAVDWLQRNKAWPEYCARQLETYRRVCGKAFADVVQAKFEAGVKK